MQTTATFATLMTVVKLKTSASTAGYQYDLGKTTIATMTATRKLAVNVREQILTTLTVLTSIQQQLAGRQRPHGENQQEQTVEEKQQARQQEKEQEKQQERYLEHQQEHLQQYEREQQQQQKKQKH